MSTAGRGIVINLLGTGFVVVHLFVRTGEVMGMNTSDGRPWMKITVQTISVRSAIGKDLLQIHLDIYRSNRYAAGIMSVVRFPVQNAPRLKVAPPVPRRFVRNRVAMSLFPCLADLLPSLSSMDERIIKLLRNEEVPACRKRALLYFGVEYTPYPLRIAPLDSIMELLGAWLAKEKKKEVVVEIIGALGKFGGRLRTDEYKQWVRNVIIRINRMLITKADDREQKIREAVAKAFVKTAIENGEIINALFYRLENDRHAPVRAFVAEALGNIRWWTARIARGVIPSLQRRLKDYDAGVRERARISIDRIKKRLLDL